MTPRALAAEIEGLPPEDRAEIERYVRSLVKRRSAHPLPKSAPPETSRVERLRARRERLLREHGLFDMTSLIREFRETGGR